MADKSKITINGVAYNLKDTTARAELDNKQDTLTAGANIIISSENVISATGSGGAILYTAGDNITIDSDYVISAENTTYTASTPISIDSDNNISIEMATSVESSGLPIIAGAVMNEFQAFVEKMTISFNYSDFSIAENEGLLDPTKAVSVTVPTGYSVVAVLPQVNYTGSAGLMESPLTPLWYYDGATSLYKAGLFNPTQTPTSIGTVSGSATIYLTLLMIKTSYI